MRIFWFIYTCLFAIQKVILPLYFWLLSVTTAPEDTTELMKEGGEMLQALNGNPALDILILVIGLIGLMYTFGRGNWKLFIHRYASKPRLARLRDDAKRTAEDIANTLSQEKSVQNQRTDPSLAYQEDGRFLSKHMLEAHSIMKRLMDVGYWDLEAGNVEFGVAGATSFAAAKAAKVMYSASEKIRCDLEDGFLTILTKP
jgi:type IV secretory pathway VirB2 component (pilin)